MTTKTHITFVLDSSGSMAAIEDDTKGGFNILLAEQREEEGSATVTLYNFNTQVDLVYSGRSIEEAPKLDSDNYTPGGRTALHDAIRRAVDETAADLAGMAEQDRPDNVIVVVLTDGKENASETTEEQVRDRIERRREDDWEFLFIGAKQDAALTARDMGMDPDRALRMSHSGEGARAAYDSTSQQIQDARRHGRTSGYDEDDRRRQDDAGGS